MSSGIQYISYKDFVEDLEETESPTSSDKIVVSSPTNGPRSASAKEMSDKPPNLSVTSPGGTVNITSSVDPQTNVQSVALDVVEKALSIAWAESEPLSYSRGFLTSTIFSVTVGPRGDKIDYDDTSHIVNLKRGTYNFSLQYEVVWSGTPSNEIIYVGGYPVDLSYEHTLSIPSAYVIDVTDELQTMYVRIPVSDDPPQGLTVTAKNICVYAIEQVRENVVQGLLRDAGALTDAASIDVINNATQQLVSAQAALTLNVNCVEGEAPNFAIEISASAAITLTLTKTVGSTVTALWPSEAGGTSLESGKYYQLTCVGNCWTIAEFVDPNAQRSVSPQEQNQEGSDTRSVVEDEPESLGEVNDTAVGDDSGSAVR